MRALTLGYSPCPNDTFIFYALTHGRIPLEGVHIREQLEDVETLNALAMRQALDLTKISYHAFGHLRQDYALLRSGSALGRGCGPLVIAREPRELNSLRGCRIAIPGRLTTANLLLQLCSDGFEQLVAMPFHRIMAAVSSGAVEAGVIIHESRFTYQQLGLHQVIDLGQWWEVDTGLPIPLGGILARRSLGADLIESIDRALRQSIEFAQAHPEETRSYIKQHSQELADEVIDSHIALYVNAFSRDLGDEGRHAITTLLQRAEARGLIPSSSCPLFAR